MTAPKIALLLSVAALLFVAPTLAQSGKRGSGDPPEIIQIRQRFKSINAGGKRYKTRTRHENAPHYSGDTKGYYEKGILRKITVEEYSEHSEYLTEYYLWDGLLIFAYHRSTDYPNWTMENEGRAEVEEERLYFHRNRLIRRLGVKNAIKPVNAPESQKSARHEQEHSRRIAAQLNARP